MSEDTIYRRVTKEREGETFYDYASRADFDAIVIGVDGMPLVMVATDMLDSEETNRIVKVILESLRNMYRVFSMEEKNGKTANATRV